MQLLEYVGLSSSTYYHQVNRLDRPDKDADDKSAIQSFCAVHKGRYGYRRITAVMRKAGTLINHKKVQRLMAEMGLKALVRIKHYRSFRGGIGRVAGNILRRRFKAKGPNQKWTTDVTEIKVGQEKLFLSPVLDMYNGEIVAYEIGKRPVLDMITSMAKKAFAKLKHREKPLLHSDQGWQYTMPAYQKLLRDRQVLQSMSRKGNCHDNAPIESFFAVLKTELTALEKFDTFDALKAGIEQYISYYNNDRIKLGLGGLSPVEYRKQNAKA